MPHGRLYKSRHSTWNAWKTSNFCDSYIPYPGHFGRCRRLGWILPKGHDAMLAGTRHASFMVWSLPNLFGWLTPKQPRRWLCNFSQSLFISAVRSCLICGKHITCRCPVHTALGIQRALIHTPFILLFCFSVVGKNSQCLITVFITNTSVRICNR